MDDPEAEVAFSVAAPAAPDRGAGGGCAIPARSTPSSALVDGVVHYGETPVEPLRGGVYGVAIDLGTTTVVLELVDLLDGRTLEVVALENPQRFGGSDVINRISYDEADGGGELRNAVRRALNRELGELYERQAIDRREVYEVVVVGNATMRDLFFGLDVAPIGQRPYKSISELELLAGAARRPRSLTAPRARARRAGAPQGARRGARPLIASHVGADVAADLVAVGLDRHAAGHPHARRRRHQHRGRAAGNGRILVASCPAGPAFEGGSVTYGMQAAEGAIESVELDAEGAFAFRTIGDAPALGLCGSGLIDLLAVLRRDGADDPERRVHRPRADFIDVDAGAGITFSRADGSALAQAKAANTVRPVDPPARARRRPGRRRSPLPRRRLRDLRRCRAMRSTSASWRPCRSIASRRSATRRCAARVCCCSLPARGSAWPS